MKFEKEFLLELLEDDEVLVENEIVETARWTTLYSMVFEHEGKFYRTSYRVGSTEYQDESPFEYELDQIECKEVHAVQKTITVYE
jgi:hypothetical protein